MASPADSTNNKAGGGEGGPAMATPNIKHLLLLVGLLLISLYYQGSLDSPSNALLISPQQELLSSPSIIIHQQQQRELETTIAEDEEEDYSSSRDDERRRPVRQDEFWLTESDSAILPFDVAFVPPDDTYGEIKPMWECNNKVDSSSSTTGDYDGGREKKLIFVNIVRSEAMEVYQLLASYAASCHAGFASTVMCSGLSWESMKDIWANRRTKGSKYGAKCGLQKDSIDRKGKAIGRKYMNAKLLDESIDIAAGHIPLGSHEVWKNKQGRVVDVQYVVSLRCPYAWFVSSMIDKVKLEKDSGNIKTNDVISAIREKVEGDLQDNMYHEVTARYLITPSQISWIQKEYADLGIEHRVELSLTNLKKTNAIILITEDKTSSLEKLKYLIDKNGQQPEIFAKAQLQMDKLTESSPSVSKILNILKDDQELFQRLEEYLKYEAQIYEQAKDMHQRQVSWLQRNHPAEHV